MADEVRDKVIPVARSMGLDGLLDRMLAEKTTSLQVVHIDGDHGAQATITLPTLMRAYAEAAVDEARSKYRIDLDYTPESLTHVDGVMRSWTAELPTKRIERLYRRGPNEVEIGRRAKGWGAYVGEVILGTRPGGWAVGQRNGMLELLVVVDDVTARPIVAMGQAWRVDPPTSSTDFYRMVIEQAARNRKE